MSRYIATAIPFLLACAACVKAGTSSKDLDAKRVPSFIVDIQSDDGGFLGYQKINLGMSVALARERMGPGWSCFEFGQGGGYFACDRDGGGVPCSISLDAEDGNVSYVSFGIEEPRERTSICADFRAARSTLAALFGVPEIEDETLCGPSGVDGEYVRSCAMWRRGDSQMVLGAKPSLERLRSVALTLTFSSVGTPVCEWPLHEEIADGGER